MPSLPCSVFWRDSFTKYFGDAYKQIKHEPSATGLSFLLSEFLNRFFLINLFAPILIAFILLFVPLSTSKQAHSHDVNPWLFILFQCIYTIIGYPLMLFTFDFSIPGLSICIKYWCILLVGQVFIICYFIAFHYFNFSTLALLRAFGPIFYASGIMIVYAIYACYLPIKLGRNDINIHASEVEDGFLPRNSISMSRDNKTSINDVGDNFRDNEVITKCHHSKQYFFAVLFLGAVFTEFFFCQWLTVIWNERRKRDQYASDAMLFLFFYALQSVFRFVFKRFARYNDTNKIVTCDNEKLSTEVCTEYMCNTYYFIFYRNLFLSINSLEAFFIMKAIHVSFELLFYVIRMSKVYFKLTAKLQLYLFGDENDGNKGSLMQRSERPKHAIFRVLSFLYDPSPYNIWIVRVTLDYTLRSVCGITSCVAYIVGSLFLRYGYNQEFYSFIHLDSSDQFAWTIYYTTFAFGIETLLFVISAILMYRYYDISIAKPYIVLLQTRPTYLLFFVFTMAHVITDVFLAELNL